MDNYLLEHAIKNVWCTPDQDDQLIFKLARLSQFNGVINKYQYHWDYITLPEKNVKFHIYHIGQIHPVLLNLLDTSDECDRLIWKTFKEVMNTKNTTINLYTKYGIELPRFCSYYLVTQTNDIIIAIKENNFFDFNNDDVYFRTYLNSYFSSDRQVVGLDYIKTNGLYISNNNNILALQNEVSALKTKAGYVTCTINGYKQCDIDLIKAKIGDYVEYVYDSSIKKLVTLTVSNLKTFDSTLDLKGKYLLHYPGRSDIIDYQDDIDIYLVQKSTGKGVYIHKNVKDTLRNITHKDYSLVTSYVNDDFYHFKNDSGIIDTTDLAIELHIRKSGYDRRLVYEINRINELYKLTDSKLVNALVGINSTLDIWKAANLEQSAYINLMKVKYKDISLNKVVNTYGYDSIAYTLANNIKEVYLSGTVRKVDVPYLFMNGCTVYEYDSNGLLLGWFIFNGGQTYVCQTTSNYVEFIYGVGGQYLDEYKDSDVDIKLADEYRVYVKTNNEWADITSSDYYFNISNHLTFNHSKLPENSETLVRLLNKFLCLESDINYNNGCLIVPIIYKQKNNNVYSDMVMSVPLGNLEVFLNGYSLIQGIDFYYKSSAVYITNKSYLKDSVTQHVLLRFSGFCNTDMSIRTTSDTGFIQQGNVSDDHQYDIKDGILTRVIVDGRLKLPSTINYYEDNNVNSTYNEFNGKPYQIKNTFVPIKSLTNVDTYSIFNNENTVDKKISEYLTLNISQVSQPNLSVNTTKHYLYSLFLSNIINDLVDGTIIQSTIPDRIDNDYIYNACKSYEYLLKDDPIFTDNFISRDYVIIHPHPYNHVINLNIKQYRFIEAVVNMYAKGAVELVNQIKLI